jgi:hypothetical protein
VVEEWIAVGSLKQKKKSPPSGNKSSIGRLPKEADADQRK